jgi:AcrR family transcriptional regulator
MNDLKQTILKASVSIIAKEGVRALSFREVARRANVSHQAPYHYFKNHFAILKAIAENGFLMLAEQMDSAAKKHSDPVQALTASGIAYVEFAILNLGHFRVMFQRPLIFDQKLKRKFVESEKAHNVLLSLCQKAWESGVSSKFKKNFTSENLALLCWSTVHGLATLQTEGIINLDKPKQKAKISRMVVESLGSLLS